eukprot:CAMPEP_0119345592 /NCGR_PEP_ID=MMETSP1333-20130426/107568_1 /TAXON_ID=418940 /ORGANISM="Scyphosphaera apsteinii, Strain RCC1455" /LENGTH=144 /DNA_ID=CAMNT_0007358069 /DNA_START=110 /DNA_END=544 /DNA_ORIENTATION=+
MTCFIAMSLRWLLRSPEILEQAAKNATEEEYFQRILKEQDMSKFGGESESYRWTQTNAEIEVSVPLQPYIRAKDVHCSILPNQILLSVASKPILQGPLLRKVCPDECDWSIEGRGASRSLKLMLLKAEPTQGSQHWTNVIKIPE